MLTLLTDTIESRLIAIEDEGREAHDQGAHYDENPYCDNSGESFAWHSGWWKAQANKEGAA